MRPPAFFRGRGRGLFAGEFAGLVGDEVGVGEVVDAHGGADLFEGLSRGGACGLGSAAEDIEDGGDILLILTATLADGSEGLLKHVDEEFLYGAVAYAAAGVVVLEGLEVGVLGEIFGEAYIAPESGALLNDVVAVEDSAVIFFDVRRIITVCSSACRFHSMVVQNLFFAISEKNRKLVQKLGHMSKRSTREKLISYLSEEAKKQNNSKITIPFNRQQLADFLSVDRSAMSNELCKMRNEGLIEFEKNNFKLL